MKGMIIGGRDKKRRRAEGFTLAEVVVSMAVMSIAVVIVAGAFAGFTRFSKESAEVGEHALEGVLVLESIDGDAGGRMLRGFGDGWVEFEGVRYEVRDGGLFRGDFLVAGDISGIGFTEKVYGLDVELVFRDGARIRSAVKVKRGD